MATDVRLPQLFRHMAELAEEGNWPELLSLLQSRDIEVYLQALNAGEVDPPWTVVVPERPAKLSDAERRRIAEEARQPTFEQQYWEEITSIADELAQRAQELAEEGNDDPGHIAEQLDEYLWQMIDSHQFVVYTYQAQQVVMTSHNDEYGLSEGLVRVESGAPLPWSQLAYWAMDQDVREESDLYAIAEAAVEAAEEDDEDDLTP
jgi:hypothetical protein